MTFADHQTRRVPAALRASQYVKNTVVVLFSDHGYHLGEKEHMPKHALWEESTRVPLIIARAGPQQRTQAALPDGLINVYPTLLELCGLSPKPELEDASLLPLIEQRKQK